MMCQQSVDHLDLERVQRRLVGGRGDAFVEHQPQMHVRQILLGDQRRHAQVDLQPGPEGQIGIDETTGPHRVDGAAEQLHMDHEVGSIECGKWADFAVLDASPLEVDPLAIKDIGIWGTVVGGTVHEAPRPA